MQYIANIKDGRIDHHVIFVECEDDLSKLKDRADRKEIEIYSLKPIDPPTPEEKAKKGYLNRLF